MTYLLLFVDWLLGLYVFILIMTAIASWLVAFNVIDTRNNIARRIVYALDALTEPSLSPLRRYVPSVGGIDLSFIVLFILFQLIRSVVIPDLIDVLNGA
jgi:YggT family protein